MALCLIYLCFQGRYDLWRSAASVVRLVFEPVPLRRVVAGGYYNSAAGLSIDDAVADYGRGRGTG